MNDSLALSCQWQEENWRFSMCVTLTKQAGFNEAEGKDVDELLECCNIHISTDKLEQLR
jgi:hypothetical protein